MIGTQARASDLVNNMLIFVNNSDLNNTKFVAMDLTTTVREIIVQILIIKKNDTHKRWLNYL